MSAFKEIVDKRGRRPLRHVILNRCDFADPWPAKPADQVILGLRKIADGDIQTARAEAAKFAVDMHEDEEGRIEAYNDCLMRWMIIAGTCDENDTGVTAPIFEGSEENVRFALTSGAIRFLWDNIDAFHVEMNPFVREISDEDLERLAARLLTDPLPENLPTSTRIRIKKFLGFVLQEIENVENPMDEEDELVTLG